MLGLERGKLVLANRVRIVPQRSFLGDWRCDTDRPPRSYGIALIHALSDNQSKLTFLVPLLNSEVVWLGLEAVDPATPIMVRIDSSDYGTAGAPRTASQEGATGYSWTASYICPPNYAIKGVLQRDLWRPFGRFDGALAPHFETIAICVYDLEHVRGDAAMATQHTQSNKMLPRGHTSTRQSNTQHRSLACATIAFVDHDSYIARANCESLRALDRNQGYQDWRLP